MNMFIPVVNRIGYKNECPLKKIFPTSYAIKKADALTPAPMAATPGGQIEVD